MLLSVNPEHPQPRKIQRAIDVVAGGGVICYPTDTVYGIGCDILNKKSIDRLYQVKGMPRTKPLAFICADLANIARYAVVDNTEYRILKRFLPGPYCFILRATREVPRMVQTKQKTVGIRIPNHPVTQALVEGLGRPLISTTACEADGEPLVDPWSIDATFPGLDLVVEADTCGHQPTTVVDLSQGGISIIREGAGPIDELV